MVLENDSGLAVIGIQIIDVRHSDAIKEVGSWREMPDKVSHVAALLRAADIRFDESDISLYVTCSLS